MGYCKLEQNYCILNYLLTGISVIMIFLVVKNSQVYEFLHVIGKQQRVVLGNFLVLLVVYTIHFSFAGNYYSFTLFLKQFVTIIVMCIICSYLVYVTTILIPEKKILYIFFICFLLMSLGFMALILFFFFMAYFLGLDNFYDCRSSVWIVMVVIMNLMSLVLIAVGIAMNKELKNATKNAYLVVNRNIEKLFWYLLYRVMLVSCLITSFGNLMIFIVQNITYCNYFLDLSRSGILVFFICVSVIVINLGFIFAMMLTIWVQNKTVKKNKFFYKQSTDEELQNSSEIFYVKKNNTISNSFN